ncbi:MAG: hypothetical protein QNK03_02475 [Myxococcota bacterium]|nr:hypothetical protein [Myxococcota bacterium]
MSVWIALLALLVSACTTGTATTEPRDAVGPSPDAPSSVSQSGAKGAASSNRLVFEGCEPVAEARRYAHLVGEEVLIRWAWTDAMSQPGARLLVPAVVLRIDPASVAVRFDPGVANLQLYTSVWTSSGHIRGNADGSFAVDPCSATLQRGSW